MNFINCNYPNTCKIPKGKPKELKSTMLKIKKNKITLIEQKQGTIWFKEGNYFWGIELDLKYNNLKLIDIFGTVGAVNLALLDWNGELLGRDQEDLLYTYLKNNKLA